MSLVTHLIASTWITVALVSFGKQFRSIYFRRLATPAVRPKLLQQQISRKCFRPEFFLSKASSWYVEKIWKTFITYQHYMMFDYWPWVFEFREISHFTWVNSKMALVVRNLFSSLTYTSIPHIQHGRGFVPLFKLLVDLCLLVRVFMTVLTLAQNLVVFCFYCLTSHFRTSLQWTNKLIYTYTS